MKRKRLLKKRARRLPAKMQNILASKGSGRSGKRRWRDDLASRGTASEVRIIVKDGKVIGCRLNLLKL